MKAADRLSQMFGQHMDESMGRGSGSAPVHGGPPPPPASGGPRRAGRQ
jgi:hypothetical protein